MISIDYLRSALQKVHNSIVARCLSAAESAWQSAQPSQLAAVADDHSEGDTQYAIDVIGEQLLLELLEEVAAHAPIMVWAEGLGAENGEENREGGVILPAEAQLKDVQWALLIDPIDGTRGLMYQKRSAWILTGVAPVREGKLPTSLSDITCSLMTEVPLVKQHLYDQLWAQRGQGCEAQRINRFDGTAQTWVPRPSKAVDVAHGFGSLSRFFPGNRALSAAIDDALIAELLEPPSPGKALCFEDQYISTGGQLYELIVGHDRFIADLRPLLARKVTSEQRPLCCHPYDLSTMLIAEEVGIILTDEQGERLDPPWDLDSDVNWQGFANKELAQQVIPCLQRILCEHGLISQAVKQQSE